MKPADQTTFGVPGGNCFSACVASILELDVTEVPYFMSADDWSAALEEWLRPRGYYPVFLQLDDAPGAWRPAGFYVLGGESPRGPHAVVALGATVVHDPHPTRAGLVRHEDATLIVPVDPAHRGGAR